jgi:hypothetical protein
VASERQAAANQRNARRSTGPRSNAGKTRASRNAYRHGLSYSISSSAAFAKELEQLARKIAGDTENAIILERARAVAQAELELGRVRQAKVALITRAMAFGTLDPPPRINSTRLIIRWLKARERYLPVPKPIDHSATMPSQEPDRSAEAIRRALPELLKLDRYERRASARRDRAIRDIAGGRIKSIYNL